MVARKYGWALGTGRKVNELMILNLIITSMLLNFLISCLLFGTIDLQRNTYNLKFQAHGSRCHARQVVSPVFILIGVDWDPTKRTTWTKQKSDAMHCLQTSCQVSSSFYTMSGSLKTAVFRVNILSSNSLFAEPLKTIVFERSNW